MAANNRYQKKYTGSDYIEGNTVRKLNNLPDIRRNKEEYETAIPRRQNHRQTKAISGINLASLLILSAAVIATVFLCVDYLKLQSNINQTQNKISVKQEELITLTKDNNAALAMIKDNYDLDYIYHKAVKELGMVYPNKNTVITYQGSDDDYVKKLEEIPK